MNELAMDLSAAAVNDRYFEVLIIPQAAIAEVLCKLFTVLDSLQVILKIDADPVSHRDAIFHIEKECLHYSPLTPIRRIRNRSERDPAAISHFLTTREPWRRPAGADCARVLEEKNAHSAVNCAAAP